MQDQVPQFSMCPRCGERGFDILRTHSYCVLCLYSPDLNLLADDYSVPPWALEAIKNTKPKKINSLGEPAATHVKKEVV